MEVLRKLLRLNALLFIGLSFYLDGKDRKNTANKKIEDI
jgi:hypothetical protein